MKRFLFILCLLMAFTMLLSACGDDDDDDNNDDIDDDNDTIDDDDDNNDIDDDNDDDNDDDDDDDDDEFIQAEVTLIDGGAPGQSGISLALTDDGQAVIAATYIQGLFVYTPAESDFSAEFVAASASTPSLAIDAEGHFHLAYRNTEQNSLVYANNAAGQWDFTTVDEETTVGPAVSLALDGDGAIHIAYYDRAQKDLRYATNASGSWATSTVDILDDVGHYCSIAADAAGKIHVAYEDETNNNLKYAVYENGGWLIENVNYADEGGKFCSLAVDQTGAAHISYGRDSSGDHVRYATNSSGEWVNTAITDHSGTVLCYTSIAVDENNHAHICYFDYRGFYSLLYYANNVSGEWVEEYVARAPEENKYSSLDLDAEGHLHIGYYELGALMYATDLSGNWSIEEIERGVIVSGDQMIAGDSQDVQHVCYYDLSNYKLKYADNRDGQWHTTVIDDTESGTDCAIALDSDDHVYISFAGEGPSQYSSGLTIADNVSGDWSMETVVAVEHEYIGGYSSVVVDDDGHLHVSYYQIWAGDKGPWPTGDLYYTTNADGEWKTHLVAAGNLGTDVGKGNSLALDSAGNVHISYWNSNLGLMYATNAGVLWQRQCVHLYGKYSSLKCDSADGLHLSFYFEEGGDLKYAVKEGETWTKHLIDGQDDVGQDTSLALDDDGFVHISYYDVTNKALKYATNRSGEWKSWTIYQNDDLSGYTALSLDNSGLVHITFLSEGAIQHAQFTMDRP